MRRTSAVRRIRHKIGNFTLDLLVRAVGESGLERLKIVLAAQILSQREQASQNRAHYRQCYKLRLFPLFVPELESDGRNERRPRDRQEIKLFLRNIKDGVVLQVTPG